MDPGLASTGWGVLDRTDGRVTHVAHGSIETEPGSPAAERLLRITMSLRELVDAHAPTESAVETLYFGRNVSSAIPVAQARGAILAALAERGLAVRELAPNEIKQGVAGTARADKRQVQAMVRVILGLERVPSPDHAADALAAAICAANRPAFADESPNGGDEGE